MLDERIFADLADRFADTKNRFDEMNMMKNKFEFYTGA